MVRVQANAIRVEVGFGVSYQWAVDAQSAIVRKFETGKAWFLKAYAAILSMVAMTADNTQQAVVTKARVTRDNLAALLIGVPVEKLPELRRMVLNPSITTTPAVKSKARTKSEPTALSTPKTGANVDAYEFKQALKQVKMAIGNARSAWPILNNVLIRQDGDRLVLTCFNLEVGIETKIRAGIGKFLPLTVPAKQLLDAIGNAKGEVHIEYKGKNEAVFTIEGRTVQLLTLPAEEFRPLPVIESPKWQEIPEFSSALRSVIPAVSGDSTREILNGVLITADSLVATDTHRLHVAKHGAKLKNWPKEGVICPFNNRGGGGNLVIPNNALGIKDDEPIEVSVGEGMTGVNQTGQVIQFRAGDSRISSRIIDGQFPNIERVIPKSDESVQTWTIVKEPLMEALRQVSVVARDSANRVIFHHPAGKDEIRLSAESGDTGKSEAVVTQMVVNPHTEEFKIAFNCNYILQALSQCGDRYEGVDIKLYGALNPAMITPLCTEDRFAVLMPMQII